MLELNTKSIFSFLSISYLHRYKPGDELPSKASPSPTLAMLGFRMTLRSAEVTDIFISDNAEQHSGHTQNQAPSQTTGPQKGDNL